MKNDTKRRKGIEAAELKGKSSVNHEGIYIHRAISPKKKNIPGQVCKNGVCTKLLQNTLNKHHGIKSYTKHMSHTYIMFVTSQDNTACIRFQTK